MNLEPYLLNKKRREVRKKQSTTLVLLGLAITSLVLYWYIRNT